VMQPRFAQIDLSGPSAMAVDDALVRRLLCLGGRGLTLIDLRNTCVTDRLLAALSGRYARLTHLQLQESECGGGLGPAAVHLVHSSPSLRSLSLTGFSRLASLEAARSSFPTGLEELALHGCVSFQAQALTDTIQRLPGLRRLFLTRMAALSDEHLAQLRTFHRDPTPLRSRPTLPPHFANAIEFLLIRCLLCPSDNVPGPGAD